MSVIKKRCLVIVLLLGAGGLAGHCAKSLAAREVGAVPRRMLELAEVRSIEQAMQMEGWVLASARTHTLRHVTMNGAASEAEYIVARTLGRLDASVEEDLAAQCQEALSGTGEYIDRIHGISGAALDHDQLELEAYNLYFERVYACTLRRLRSGEYWRVRGHLPIRAMSPDRLVSFSVGSEVVAVPVWANEDGVQGALEYYNEIRRLRLQEYVVEFNRIEEVKVRQAMLRRAVRVDILPRRGTWSMTLSAKHECFVVDGLRVQWDLALLSVEPKLDGVAIINPR